jgi:hypothetical protein
VTAPPFPKRWPQVPACYEWLSLDRRGQWRLQGERVSHPGLLAFLNQHYQTGDDGCWFVQNGPQKVYADLAATPWVFRRSAGRLLAHTGAAAGEVSALFLDAEGSLYLLTELGFGLLDDRDLAVWLAECQPDDEAIWLALLAGESIGVTWRGLPVERVEAADLSARFAFNPRPRA